MIAKEHKRTAQGEVMPKIEHSLRADSLYRSPGEFSESIKRGCITLRSPKRGSTKAGQRGDRRRTGGPRMNRLSDTVQHGRILFAAPHWAAGFCSLNVHADNRNNSDMRCFYVRDKPSCAQIMMGRGREAFAPAGFMYASLQTLLRLITPFCSGLMRFNEPVHEAATMVATPTPLHPEFTQTHRLIFTFLIASVRTCRLAELRHIRTVSAVADTEAQARSVLVGLPLVFLSRTPCKGVAA